MPAPTYVASGAGSSGAGTITPALPAGILANDILLLVCESANEPVTISNQNGGTWAQVTNSPQGSGTAAGAGAARLTVYWSRYNGTQGAPTLADAGDHVAAFISAFRGCKTTGDPWNITSGAGATLSTSVSVPGATTTVAECRVVILAALMDDAQGFGTTWTNASLVSIVSNQVNYGHAAGNDGRIGLSHGVKTAAGAYGATTNTLTAASHQGLMSIALEPAPSGFTLAADPVALSITVAAMTLLKTSLLSAAAVSLAITPADMDMRRAARLTADPVALSISVADATLTYTPAVGYLLNADPVSLTITPAAADLRVGRRLAADPVSLAVTVSDLAFPRSYRLAADPVALAVTPAAADLRRGSRLSADPVALTIAIANHSLIYEPAAGFTLAADPVALAITVAAADLRRSYALQASPVALAITIAEATLAKAVFARSIHIHRSSLVFLTRHTATLTVKRRHGTSVMDTYTGALSDPVLDGSTTLITGAASPMGRF